MAAAAYTLQMVLLTLSGWVRRHQQDVIEYLVEETACALMDDLCQGEAIELPT